MTKAKQAAIDWVEHGYVPDSVIRHSIRRLLRSRLDSLPVDDPEASAALEQNFVRMMDLAPIALVPEKANEQHYELPPRFFDLCLGMKQKYSCCFWPRGVRTLDQAEVAALQASCEHAELEDGMRILELGCGWGSLTIWMAERYPNNSITAVSNSVSQRGFIESRLTEKGLHNVRVITCDMNDYQADETFDRVVSVEMFEHLRNYRQMFSNICDWLNPGGKFFMHIFCHRSCPYEFEDRGPSDWMSRYFFSGGIMPSDDLPLRFQERLKLRRRWRWNGQHYEKTCNAWLDKMDLNEPEIMQVLADTYGKENARRWWMRWRMFYMACAELFGYDEGRQWWVSHYLFEKPAVSS